MIRHSSAEAFHDDDRRAMALRQRERIAALLLERGPMTGQMIAAATGLVPGTVSARIVELRDEHFLIVELDDRRECAITGRRVRWVAHKDTAANQQMGLPLNEYRRPA